MIVTLLSTLLFALLIWEACFLIFLCNDYFFGSGRRSPTSLDFYIFFSIFISPLFGGMWGFKIGRKLHEAGKGLSVYLTPPYLYAIIATLALLVLIAILLFLMRK